MYPIIGSTYHYDCIITLYLPIHLCMCSIICFSGNVYQCIYQLLLLKTVMDSASCLLVFCYWKLTVFVIVCEISCFSVYFFGKRH